MRPYTSILKAITLALIVSCATTAFAKEDRAADRPDRKQVFAQMKNYKHDLIARELNLDKDTREAFFKIYDQLDNRLRQIATETRDLEKKTLEDTDASDTEIEAAATEIYSQKLREGQVEEEYYESFKKILTPRQLLKLKSAERKFNQSLLRHNRNRRK